MAGFMDRVGEDFDQRYAEAIKCDEYAVVQVSPRKFLVLKDRNSHFTSARGLTGDMQTPRRYDVVATCPNFYTAQNYIRGLIKKERGE